MASARHLVGRHRVCGFAKRLRHIDGAELQLHLVVGDAREVEKIVDEADEVIHLPSNDLPGPFGVLGRSVERVERESDRASGLRSSCERVARKAVFWRSASRSDSALSSSARPIKRGTLIDRPAQSRASAR